MTSFARGPESAAWRGEAVVDAAIDVAVRVEGDAAVGVFAAAAVRMIDAAAAAAERRVHAAAAVGIFVGIAIRILAAQWIETE